MQLKRLRFGLPVLLAGSTILAGGILAATLGFTPVPSANPKVAGLSSPNAVPPELVQLVAARGSNPVENPVAGGGTVPAGCPAVNGGALRLAPNAGQLVSIGYYGYDTTVSAGAFVDGPMVPAPGDVQSATHRVEATKTEPDINTYLVLHNQEGPDGGYDYGKHYLYQGHEVGRGYITRINLDADYAHRVTVLASSVKTFTPISNSSGVRPEVTAFQDCPLPTIDGSGWDPFAHKLLFTSESASNQSILQISPDFGSIAEDLTPWMGQGAYEGIALDKWGRVYLVEDAGGTTGTGAAALARQPNSFVYRYVPYVPGDLKQGGQLQVLQVTSLANAGQPIVFGGATHSNSVAQANIDVLSQDVKDLHTYGKTFDTKWITIHDTAVSGTSWTGTANALAKAMNGTPFKRPENGRFRPDTDFSEFYFTETADTNANTLAGSTYGGFGAIFMLKLLGNSAGKLSLFYNSPDAVHAGFDNLSFWDTDHFATGEDAGDTLHAQRNGLDSVWFFNAKTNYSNPSNEPKRLLAEGRDPSATIDSALSGSAGYQNDGDNEITGWLTSDGDPSIWGLLGAKAFKAFQDGHRTFFTAQHGDNFTYEIVPEDKDDFIKDHKYENDNDRRYGFDRRKNGHDWDDDDHGRGNAYAYGRNW